MAVFVVSMFKTFKVVLAFDAPVFKTGLMFATVNILTLESFLVNVAVKFSVAIVFVA